MEDTDRKSEREKDEENIALPVQRPIMAVQPTRMPTRRTL